MSATQNPVNTSQNESKSAKKKKAKATAVTQASEADAAQLAAKADAIANGADSPNESPIVRELKKYSIPYCSYYQTCADLMCRNIRNVKKKLVSSFNYTICFLSSAVG